MSLLEAHIEEFEQGTWVADLIADQSFSGSFQLPDGSTWMGTKVSEVADRGRFFSKVVGGNGALGRAVLDQFYQGQISLQVVVNAIAGASSASPGDTGETVGGVATGVFLTQYQRFVGSRSEALDAVAKAAGGAVNPGADPLLWWIGRDGQLQMQLPNPTTGARSSTGLVSGTQDMNRVDVDGSVELVQPTGAVLGAMYGTPTAAPVRHIRWKYTGKIFSARLFFVPFLFRAPAQTKYDRTYNAKIIADNGDGTVDVLAYRSPSEGKAPAFNVSKVQLFCGVPGSKVTMIAGEECTLGFFGGDPQKPFAMSMKQNTAVPSTKKVARVGDKIRFTLTAANVAATVLTAPPPGYVVAPGPSPVGVVIEGTIVEGSSRLLVGDL